MVIEPENISGISSQIYIEHLKVYDIITNTSDVNPENDSIREYLYADSSEQMTKESFHVN